MSRTVGSIGEKVMENNAAKLYARLRVKTGSYPKDGKTKNRYSEIGVMFASPHFSNVYLQIETLPINKDWDGRVYVDPIEQNDVIQVSPTHQFNKQVNEVVLEDIEDKPIDLTEIPF